MPTKEELKQLQSLPLEIKILKTKERIREWINYYGVDGVYVSFSGGKDSTVLLHLVREMYPSVEAVFVNTGLEYPEIQSFVKSFDNVTILRPKMRFDEVIRKYGYPFISKRVACAIRSYKEGRQWAVRSMNGLHCQTGEPNEFSQNQYGKWKALTEVDFNISDKCCGVMKEKPLIEYQREIGKVAFLATLADESYRRTNAWLKTGCNAFDSKEPKSKPLSFWTEQDILQYIKLNNLPIAKVYGDIVYGAKGDDEQYDNLICDCGQKLCTTGRERTGWINTAVLCGNI